MSGTPTFSFGGVPDSCFQNPSEIPGVKTAYSHHLDLRMDARLKVHSEW